MADERVGGVYIEIGSEVAKGTPGDTIKEIRAAVKKAAEIKLPVGLEELKKSALQAARREAQAAAKTMKAIELPTTLAAPKKSLMNAARKAAQEAVKGLKPIEFPTDLKHITARQLIDVEKRAQRLADMGEIEFNVEPGKGATWRRKLNDMVDDIEDQDAEIPVVPDIDDAAAKARLAALTRMRKIELVPELNKSAMAAVTGQLLALSGARAVTDRIRGLGRALMNLDRSIPAIAGVSTAILNLGSAALAGVGNLLTLGGSLASIAAVGLTLPGIFAGFGVGIGVMVAALADADEVLADLGPKFSELQDTISSNFWAEAEGPIRDLANKALPLLNDRLGEVSTELGIFFGSFADALGSADNLSHLDAILGNVRDSIDIAGEGIAHFTDAMMGLIDVGASYLPDLASWFNRVSEDLSSFIEEATNSGEIFDWIDTGIQAMQDLGRVVWGLGGVFSNMARAASEAGGAGLGDLADGLEEVNRVMEGPAFQGAMTTVFQGASDAMAALGPGVRDVGDAFLEFAPTLAEIMRLAGEIGGTALSGIASAFEQPAFQGGLQSFFEGVLSAVETLEPHMPALADAFGSVAEFAGTLAEVLGGVLGAAIEALAPVVEDLMAALGPVAEVLGGALTAAIEAVAPLIQELVESISQWVQENPELAATIGAVAVGLGLLLGGLMSVIGPIASFALSLISAVGAAGGLSAVVGAVSAALSAAAPVIAIVAGVVAIVAGALLALAGMFVYAWQTSEQFRTAIQGFGEALMAFIAPAIAFFQETVIPVVMQVWTAFQGMAVAIMDALVPLFTVVVEIATVILEALTPIVTFIWELLAPAFQFLGTVVSAVFTAIGVIISEAINIITAILQVFLAVLKGDWSGAWLAIQNLTSVVFEAVRNIINAGIEFAKTVINGGLVFIRGIWSAIWGAIGGVVRTVWGTIRGVVSQGINFVRNVVNNGLSAIRGLWATVWGTISAFAASVWSRITSIISNGIARVRNFVSNGLNSVRNTFSSVWGAISGFVSSIWGRITATISGAISRVRSTVTNGLNAVKARFASILVAIISGIRSRIGAVVGAFRSMMDRAKNTVNGFIGQFRNIGARIIDGLAGGIRSAAGRAASAAKGAVTGALNKAKSALGIASPSKEFYKVGDWSVEGLVNALEDGARTAARAAEDLVAPPAPASFNIPTGIASPLLTKRGSVPVEPSADARAEGAGITLSDETIQRLAETMSKLPVTLKVNHRQAGTLTMSGQQSVTMMGGNRL